MAVLIGATCLGLALPAAVPAIDLAGVTDADIDGHSGAFGAGADAPGQGGSGALSLVARELGVAEHNHAVNGATLLRAPFGDDWVEILAHTYRGNPAPPFGRKPRIALIWHGGNDFVVLGDAFAAPYAQVLRTVVSRHRSSAVYEETDSSVGYSHPSWFYANGPGQSGTGFLVSQTEGAPITINVSNGQIPAGGTLALGFYAHPGRGALHSISVDGTPHTPLDTRGVATAASGGLGLVYRIKNLPAGPHTVTITPQGIQEATYFDYWQVEPRDAQPVVLVNQYRLPGAEQQPLFPDARVFLLNAIQDAIAAEFDGQVVTVDTDSVINRSPTLLYDGLHPNQAGHNGIANAILDRLGRPATLPPPPPTDPGATGMVSARRRTDAAAWAGRSRQRSRRARRSGRPSASPASVSAPPIPTCPSCAASTIEGPSPAARPPSTGTWGRASTGSFSAQRSRRPGPAKCSRTPGASSAAESRVRWRRCASTSSLPPPCWRPARSSSCSSTRTLARSSPSQACCSGSQGPS